MTSVEITANARAFGDGQHPTTHMVLAALAAIDTKEFTPRIACDMGCGSGILSLAIAQKFHCPVVAVDVLRESIEATRANAATNGVIDILAIHSDGFNHPDIRAHGPFDLIVMNILAEPLLALAKDAHDALAPGGVVIISGLLLWQEEQIKAAYEGLDLECAARLQRGDWVALSFQKP